MRRLGGAWRRRVWTMIEVNCRRPVKAIWVCSDAAKLSLEEVRDFVGEKIAGFKKPREINFVEELPHVNNEIDREAVKAKWGAN